ncbi:MAG: sigma-70 family RNA polymerase sigma factor [Candidatus Rokubacteria bacterium]|nr:sigma-70 family RNA polymerase sigma factor [Candidatus Rokubacteria bacterium]
MTTRRPELELFRALVREDEGALMEFSSRLRHCVRWVLNRMAGGFRLEGEVEDLVAEARSRLEGLRERGFGGGPQEFRSYLYKVVVSVCADAANRGRWLQSLDAPIALPDGDEKPLGAVLEDLVASPPVAEADLEQAESGRRVRQALARLDARCRDLLERFHFSGARASEIAQGAATRTNTVEVALARCRQRLYAALLASYVDAPAPAWRARVAEAAERLPAELGRIFRAWWTEHRSLADIGKEVGLPATETKRRLGRAKREVWRLVGEVTS